MMTKIMNNVIILSGEVVIDEHLYHNGSFKPELDVDRYQNVEYVIETDPTVARSRLKEHNKWLETARYYVEEVPVIIVPKKTVKPIKIPKVVDTVDDKPIEKKKGTKSKIKKKIMKLFKK